MANLTNTDERIIDFIRETEANGIQAHLNCQVFYCLSCRSTFAPSEFAESYLHMQACPNCEDLHVDMSAADHLESCKGVR